MYRETWHSSGANGDVVKVTFALCPWPKGARLAGPKCGAFRPALTRAAIAKWLLQPSDKSDGIAEAPYSGTPQNSRLMA